MPSDNHPEPVSSPNGSHSDAPRASFIRWAIGWLFRSTWGLIQIGFLTLFVMAIAALVGYHVMQRYVGGETVETPAILKEDLSDALVLLDEKGLHLTLDRMEYNTGAPPGTVVDQFPWPNTKVKSGTPVRVVVSGGSALITVPQVEGLSLKAAEIRIEEAHLDRGHLSNGDSMRTPRGSVLTCDPPPGTKVDRGSKINLLISSGPPALEIAMPRLVGLTREEADEKLSLLWLRIDHTDNQERSDVPPQTIVGQSPPPGTLVHPDQAVSVAVAKTPADWRTELPPMP